MKRCAFAVVLVAATLSSWAAFAADCQKFTDALDYLDKEASELSIADVGDNSVYRAILAQDKLADVNAQRAMNIQLMAAAKCPLPATPISNTRYISPALSCKTAQSQKILAGSSDLSNIPECDRSKWKPGL